MPQLREHIRALFGDCAYRLGSRVRILSAQKVWLSAIQQNWKTIEYFDPNWKKRITAMAQYVPAGSSVMDLGCGPMWLKEERPDLIYTGVDYTYRDADNIVADFNKKQFPNRKCDVAFISGCLEYIESPEWLITQVALVADRCVLSYCVIDIHNDLISRRREGWVNDLSRIDIENLFLSKGFSLSEQLEHDNNVIFVFDRMERD